MTTKNSEHPLALPVGTELVGDYVITKVLGAGGFGITYEATERSLDRTVAIKEYFPIDIVEREGWALVKARSTELHIKYARGLRRFIEEAKAITQFNHPNIVRVLRYFKTNNTAFMVLHYEDGIDMGSWQETLHKPPTQNQLAGIVMPLLDALQLIHKNDFLHRDVAPDNIIIRRDGSPILIDFGSARSELTFNSKTVSALVKSGYSPFEQYAKNSKEQGPWTDIYSFGATLYQMVTGEAPPDSLSRLADDEMIPAIMRSKKYYGRDFLAAIDAALAIKISDRPQSIEEWRAMLFPTPAAPLTDQTASSSSSDQNNNQQASLPVQQADTPTAASAPLPAATDTRPRTGVLWRTTGQASIADLIKKAGLKPFELGDNAIKLAARIKAPLLKLVPHTNEQDNERDKTNQHLDSTPINRAATAHKPAPPAIDPNTIDEAASPRSLRSLLADLDHRYKNAEHEQVIEKVADKPLSKEPENRRKPGENSSNSLFSKGQQFWHRAQQLLPRLPLPPSPSMPVMLFVLFFGAFLGLMAVFRSELGNLADKIGLPQGIISPSDPLAPSSSSPLLKTIKAHSGGVSALRLANNKQQLISIGADQKVKVWDAQKGSLVYSYAPHKFEITALDMKGTRLVTGDANGTVSLFDFDKKQKLISFTALDGPVRSIAFVGQRGDLITGDDQGRVDYWVFKKAQYSRRSLRGRGHEQSVQAILSHNRFFVTGSTDGSAKIWGRSKRRLIRSYRGHQGPVKALALSPKAYRLATGSSDDSIKIWSPKARRVRRTMKAGQGGILSLAFAPNGKWLASGGNDNSIKVWNARNGKFIDAFSGHSKPVRALLFTTDGKRLISAGDDGIILFWNWFERRKNN